MVPPRCHPWPRTDSLMLGHRFHHRFQHRFQHRFLSILPMPSQLLRSTTYSKALFESLMGAASKVRAVTAFSVFAARARDEFVFQIGLHIGQSFVNDAPPRIPCSGFAAFTGSACILTSMPSITSSVDRWSSARSPLSRARRELLEARRGTNNRCFSSHM